MERVGPTCSAEIMHKQVTSLIKDTLKNGENVLWVCDERPAVAWKTCS